jgi:lysophospholipase L1-like esterase
MLHRGGASLRIHDTGPDVANGHVAGNDVPPSTRHPGDADASLSRRGRRPRGTRRNRWLGRLAMVSLSVGFTVVLLEGLLRTVPGLMPRQVRDEIVATPGVAHAYIGHLHTPFSRLVVENSDFRVMHDTDGHGFRNAWPWPDRADIVAVGDSLTFGYGVDAGRAWPSVLARALPGTRVVNLGLVGASAPQYLRLHELFGVPLRPALLLVGVFAQNDFWDAELFDRWWRSGAGGNYMEWRDTAPRAAGPEDEDALVRTMYAKVYHAVAATHLGRLGLHVRRAIVDRPLYYRFPDGAQVRLLVNDFEAKTVGARADRPEYRLVLEPLLQLRRLAREHGARLVVVFLPSKEEVHLPLLGVTVDDPARDLREELARQGVDHVDLVELFRARARAGQRLFFEEDGHPNADGYALIAEGILDHLRAGGYLDAVGVAPR